MANNGSGYGYGDGDGYGYGSGDGYGYGSGDGSGYGYGDGDGDGSGDGSGYGYGSGDGDGDEIGSIGKHAVSSLRPWPFVVVGCQCHHVVWWRENWKAVARKENVSVSKSQVEDLLCKVTSCAAAQTDVQ